MNPLIRAGSRSWRVLTLMACVMTVASADQSGDFTYTDDGASITITGCSSTAVGDVIVPDTIDVLDTSDTPAVIVARPVNTIGPNAFQSCTGLTSIQIPAGVTSIGSSAFDSCSSLTAITVVSTNSYFSSVDGFLTNYAQTTLLTCPGGKSGGITIPSGVTNIAGGALYGCLGLTSVTIPVGVTSIGSYAFQYCNGLTSMTIPSGVTSIGDGAFYSCIGLASVTIPSSVTSMGTYTFYNCTALTSVSLPAGLTAIAAGIFHSCTGLTSLTLPLSPVSIGGEAFKFCTKLTSLSIPSTVTSIGSGAFYGCGGLTSLVLPPGITSIAPGLFTSCVGLTSLTIPPAVTNIGGFAFQSCRGLTGIYLPAGVASVGSKAFDSCSSLIAITVDPANSSFSSVDGLLINNAQITLVVCPAGKSGGVTIPSGVTGIGPSAFLNCAKVTGVIFPSSVTHLDAQAFSNCSGLTTVTIPSTITRIESQAFSGCSALLSAYFTGVAPTTMYSNSFQATASGFSIYYFNNMDGFTSPLWYGYPAFSLGANNNPITSWLLAKGLPANTDYGDANGDGVNPLLAFALNLDPTQNLSAAIPQVGFTPTQMSLSFYAGTAGVTYTVQCSSDMKNWSTDGVSYSDVGEIRTATADRTGTSCFMRLVVSY
ncbi:MAG: leucine-rich repeat domain-containing protein [Luteolibacter sp.]